MALYTKTIYPKPPTSDTENYRLFDKMTKLGDAALSAEEFKELQEIGARMTETYSTALVCRNMSVSADNIGACPKSDQMTLEPDITQALASSRDPEMLLHLWKSWRDASGKKMRTDYQRYVELKNKAALLDG